MRMGTARIVGLLVAAVGLSTNISAASSEVTFDSAGVPIHYIEEGVGEPVVLVHGFTNTAQDWVRVGVFPELAKHYRVIALDCRGHGQSGKPHDMRQYGPEMGQDVIRLLDHLSIRRAHIVGYSMGGGIVATLVTTNPERFLSAVFGGNVGRREWTPDDERENRIEADEIEAGMMRQLTLRLAAPTAPPPSDAEIQKTTDRVLSGQDRLALAAVQRSAKQFVTTNAQMAAIRVPTLGIVGDLDTSHVDGYKQLKGVMPQLELVIIAGATHSTTPRRPEFMQALTAFLTRSARPDK